jgi:hypothetical protein
MSTRIVVAVAIFGLFPGVAVADPIIVKDDTGRTYQLNDDGTYGIVAKSADGRTFLLDTQGSWANPDENIGFAKKLADMMDKTFADHPPSNISTDNVPKYKDCLIAEFNTMKRDAKRLFVSGPDPNSGYDKLQKAYPDQAKFLDDADHSCRSKFEKPNQ